MKRGDEEAPIKLGDIYMKETFFNPNKAIKAYLNKNSKDITPAANVLLNPKYGKPQIEILQKYFVNKI